MHLMECPEALRRRGIKWPDIMVFDYNDKSIPPIGMPYVRAYNWETDALLFYRLILPTLIDKYSAYDWKNIYKEITGHEFEFRQLFYCTPSSEDNRDYYTHDVREEEMTLEELMQDTSYVDIDVIMEMNLMPTFMEDIEQAIRSNITNSFQWIDGYNKKNGLCNGYLQYQKLPKTLMIIDLSWSIPEGVSAGLLTMIHTMTEVTNADVILTGGISKFYTNEQIIKSDPRDLRREIPRSNESEDFLRILSSISEQYDTVISFGDSDKPRMTYCWAEENISFKPKRLYDFFTGEHDRYGCPATYGTGYARWCSEVNPGIEIIRETKWAKMFNE